jgi:hypothetical protein
MAEQLLFIGSCTGSGSGETAYEGALCRGSRGLLLVPALRRMCIEEMPGIFSYRPHPSTVPNCAATRLADSSMKSTTLAYPAIRSCLEAFHSTKTSFAPPAPPFGSSISSFLRKFRADVRVWEIVVLQLQKYENLVRIVYFTHGGWLKGWVIFSAATICYSTHALFIPKKLAQQ